MLGRYERQLEIGREVKRRFPEDTRHYSYQAQALAALGRLPELDAVLEESLQIPAEPAWGTVGLEIQLLASNELGAHRNPAHAHTVLARALRFADAAPLWLQRLPAQRFAVGQILLGLGRLAEARRLFEELAEGPMSERPIDAKARLGMVAALQGDLRTVDEIDGWLSNPKLPYLFGQNTEFRAGIQALLGNHEDAVRLLRQAMAEGRDYDSGKHSYPEYAGLRGYPSLRGVAAAEGLRQDGMRLASWGAGTQPQAPARCLPKMKVKFKLTS